MKNKVIFAAIAAAFVFGMAAAAGGAASETAEATVLTVETVKSLVPWAASISVDLFHEWAGGALGSELYGPGDEMPLTLVLMVAPVPDPEAREKHLRLLGPANPARIAGSIYPGVGGEGRPGSATAIHPQYITKCTLTVDGDAARGTVFYEVPDLLSGNVDYVARRENGTWRIVEFQLPHWGLRTARGDDGRWILDRIESVPEAPATGSARLVFVSGPTGEAIGIGNAPSCSLVRLSRSERIQGVIQRWPGDDAGRYEYTPEEEKEFRPSELNGGILELSPGFYEIRHNSVRVTPPIDTPSGTYGKSGIFEIRSGEEVEIRIPLYPAI